MTANYAAIRLQPLPTRNGIMKRRIVYAAVGLVYGVGLGFWAAIGSGGGHFNFAVMLMISPYGVGLLFWPAWAAMAVSTRFFANMVLCFQ